MRLVKRPLTIKKYNGCIFLISSCFLIAFMCNYFLPLSIFRRALIFDLYYLSKTVLVNIKYFLNVLYDLEILNLLVLYLLMIILLKLLAVLYMQYFPFGRVIYGVVNLSPYLLEHVLTCISHFIWLTLLGWIR